MSREDAAESRGFLYAIHDLAVALDAGRFASLDELTSAIHRLDESHQYHLMRAGVTIEWCECGAMGSSPCGECLGYPSPWGSVEES